VICDNCMKPTNTFTSFRAVDATAPVRLCPSCLLPYVQATENRLAKTSGRKPTKYRYVQPFSTPRPTLGPRDPRIAFVGPRDGLERITLAVEDPGHAPEVWADLDRGLAIHPTTPLNPLEVGVGEDVAKDMTFTVTHVRSGRYVGIVSSLQAAKAFRAALLDLDIDWTLPADELEHHPQWWEVGALSRASRPNKKTTARHRTYA
jgi:hypothetical protein